MKKTMGCKRTKSLKQTIKKERVALENEYIMAKRAKDVMKTNSGKRN